MTTPRSLVAAVEERYCNEEDDQDDLDGMVQIVLPKGATNKLGGAIPIPQRLVFHDCSIESAGNEEELAKLCGHATELDLAQNGLKEWKEVIKMLKQLGNINFVNLSNNCLRDSSSNPSEAGQTFPGVTHLILNSLHLSWTIISQLLNAFPGVVELHLSLNDYTTVDLPSDQTFTSVECLHFTGNKVAEWSTLCRLGQSFPSLVKLVLAENPLATLQGVEDVASCFPNLTSLFLGRTQIGSWSELEELKAIPCLTDLRIPEIPLLTTGGYKEKIGRQLTVAYLPRITKLNGSPVTSNEREDAERAFIRHYMDQANKPDRYSELVKVYGKLDKLVELDMEQQKIDCLIRCEDRTRLWKVNLNQTVGEFKKSLEEFAGAPRRKWRLYIADSSGIAYPNPYQLKVNSIKLSSEYIPEGAEFEILLNPF